MHFQTFKSVAPFEAHYRRHTGLFVCRYDSCREAFHDRGRLTEHHRTHNGLRTLACEHGSCSRTFARRESLESHMNMHTRERPFVCTHEGCNRSFCDRGGLIQHENGHTTEILHPCRYESCNQTFTEPFQLHRHYHKEHETIATSVKEVRPIRLRLSQPKRPNPELLESSPRKRLLIRLPIQKTLGDSLTSGQMEAHEDSSQSKSSIKGPTKRIKRRNAHHDACLDNSSFSTSSSGRYQGSSHGSKLVPTAVSHIPTLNVRPQAPTLQPIAESRSVGHNNDNPCFDGQSSEHSAPIYTRVCGVYSGERAPPEKTKTRSGRYHCPRCDIRFTRARGVRRHFVGCITRYGNPNCLKWTDHPSLQGTIKYHARKGHPCQEDAFVPPAADACRHEQKSRKLSTDAPLQSVVSEPLSSVAQKDRGSTEPVCKPSGRDVLLQRDIVRPIHKRRDALRRSKYNSETIARDVLLALGSHPDMDPLNAHLDMLRKRFRAVNLESNMDSFRWDLVDPEQEPEREPEQEVQLEQSALKLPEANGNKTNSEFNQWCYDLPSSLPSRSAKKPDVLHHEVLFKIGFPEKFHFGPMSTVFASVFDRDPSARLMSCNGDLWAAIFTLLERRYHGRTSTIRSAIRRDTGEVVGWIACHEVNTPPRHAGSVEACLDWTTAAHLLPPQLSRFTAMKEKAEEKAERSNWRKVGTGLAMTIEARASEAQAYLVPVRRLVINAIVVSPLHQGRGIASALLKSITEIADVKKRPIWVQAPEDPAIGQGVLKAGLFRRAGFTCAGELNLDLDSYAVGPRERGNGKGVAFGTYKWNYMLRWPQPLRPKTIAPRSREPQVSV